MADELPTVSVVMSVRNGETFLAEAIKSILNQTFRDFEFVIVDDGSTDRTPELLQQFQQQHRRIRVMARKKRGIPISMNEAISLSSGPLIARMDSDDIAASERLRKQVDFLNENQDCVAVGAEIMLIDPEGRPLGRGNHPRGHSEIRRCLLLGDGAAMTHPVVMFRRRAIREIGGYNEQFETGSDLDLFLRLSEVGIVENLPDILLSWRQHPSSVNRTRFKEWRRTRQQIISATIRRIGPERFAEELFPADFDCQFPNEPLELARVAFNGGQVRTALIYAWRALVNGPRRLSALDFIIELGIGASVSLALTVQRHVLKWCRGS
jgi:glycosyltransferase involved in cell wall biosynthesis